MTPGPHIEKAPTVVSGGELPQFKPEHAGHTPIARRRVLELCRRAGRRTAGAAAALGIAPMAGRILPPLYRGV
jgi:hypothetical protein